MAVCTKCGGLGFLLLNEEGQVSMSICEECVKSSEKREAGFIAEVGNFIRKVKFLSTEHGVSYSEALESMRVYIELENKNQIKGMSGQLLNFLQKPKEDGY